MTATTSTTATSPSLPRGYTLHAGLPDVPTYRHLRATSGLTPVSEPQAAGAVSGSWYGCHIRYTAAPAESLPLLESSSSPSSSWSDAGAAPGRLDGQTVVGMGRVISDGGWYFHLADMAVLPEHQRRGLGAAVMAELLAYIELHRPAEGEPYINLFADPPGRRLYEKHGFIDAADLGELGMVRVGGLGGQKKASGVGSSD